MSLATSTKASSSYSTCLLIVCVLKGNLSILASKFKRVFNVRTQKLISVTGAAGIFSSSSTYPKTKMSETLNFDPGHPTRFSYVVQARQSHSQPRPIKQNEQKAKSVQNSSQQFENWPRHYVPKRNHYDSACSWLACCD
jgi:hypothetical protein